MKIKSFIFVFLFLNVLYGQNVRFQIIRVNPCEKIEKIDSSDYYLYKTHFDSVFNNENGIVKLPKPGFYKIHFSSYYDYKSIEINIPDTGLFIYKINESKIILRSYGMHPVLVYESCGKLIEGYEEDYYPNGNIKLRGTFLKGRPKDSLLTYFPNGIIKRRLIKLSKENFIQEFDSLGTLLVVRHNSNRSYYLSDFIKKEYYNDGQIKRFERNINRLILFKEYYPNGKLRIEQSKKYRKEYYENGIKKLIYKWKRKNVSLRKGEFKFDYKIQKITYDTNGKKIGKQFFEEKGELFPQPNLEF